MNSQFFKTNKPQRLYNPTYSSGHLMQAMIPSYMKHPQMKQQPIKQQGNIQPEFKKPVNNIFYAPTIPQPIQIKQRQQRSQKIDNKLKKSRSSMASYGVVSLKSLNRISGRQVQLNQKKKYDLINGMQLNNKIKNPNYPYWKKQKNLSLKITQVPANKMQYRQYK